MFYFVGDIIMFNFKLTSMKKLSKKEISLLTGGTSSTGLFTENQQNSVMVPGCRKQCSPGCQNGCQNGCSQASGKFGYPDPK